MKTTESVQQVAGLSVRLRMGEHSREDLRAMFGREKFTVADWTSIDGCEQSPEVSERIRTEKPQELTIRRILGADRLGELRFGAARAIDSGGWTRSQT